MNVVTSFKEKFIGDKAFYKRVLLIALPMIGQNAITSFVSFLDNIMVGMIGTEQMSGVAIVNQLVFVFNICVFGGVSGAGPIPIKSRIQISMLQRKVSRSWRVSLL